MRNIGQIMPRRKKVQDLPNFEKAEDALLHNLSEFDESKLKKVIALMDKAVGPSAADLVSQLLHPRPENRLSSFEKILDHQYFVESDKSLQRST